MLNRSQRHSQRPQSVHKMIHLLKEYFFLIQKKALYRGCDHVHYSWVNIPGEVETTDIPTRTPHSHNIFTQTQAHTHPQSHLGRETPRVAAHRKATSVLTNRFSQGHSHTAHAVVSTLSDSLTQALSFVRRNQHLLRCWGRGRKWAAVE